MKPEIKTENNIHWGLVKNLYLLYIYLFIRLFQGDDELRGGSLIP